MKGKNNKNLWHIAWFLIVIGAINWGLIGVFDFDLIQGVFGSGSGLTNGVYVLIGLSGLWALWGYSQKGHHDM